MENLKEKIVFVVFIVLVFCAPAPKSHAAIALDATSTVTASVASTTLTFSHTVTSNTNGILLVGVETFSTTSPYPTATAMTYAGSALTNIGGITNPDARVRSELWYIKAPATGANNIVITFSASVTAKVAGGTSYTGVSQTTPLGASSTAAADSGTTASTTISSATNELVVDSVATRQIAAGTQALTVGAGQTQRYNGTSGTGGNSNVVGAGSEEAGAASVAMTWTVSSSARWAIVAAPLKPASAAATPVFEQSAYRWFANNNSSTVGATLTGTQDASTTLAATGDAFRLRLLLHVSTATSTVASSTFKLQYASTTPGNCGPGFYGSSTFADVATSSGGIRYNDNAGPADGNLVNSTSTDPTHSTDGIDNQTYEEANNFTVTSTIGVARDGKWDFSLIDFSAPAGTTYCFRAVNSDNSLITTSTSSKIPEIKTASGNAPTVTSVVLNNGSAITLTANTTTPISVNATISDNNGCSDITNGSTTVMMYRSGVTSSTCLGAQNYLNCYLLTVFTASSTCSSGTTNTTTTFDVYYFANATDASSSYASQNWNATVKFTDAGSATGTGDATGQELNTLLAFAVPTSTSYGTLTVGTNTSSTNTIVTVKNAGNATTTLKVNGTALISGTNSIATSSQHYATNTFTYGGAEQALQSAATDVSGWLVTRPPLGSTWATTTAYPNVLSRFPAVVNNGYIYVIGGLTGTSVYTSTVRYAPIGATGTLGSWATTTAYPSAIAYHAAVVNNGYVYVVGGYDGSYTSTVRYALINATGSLGSWATTTAYPDAISDHPAVVNNGYIYVIGGETTGDVDISTVRFALINATGSLGSWSSTTAYPNVIGDHAAIVNNGFVYAIAGCGVDSCATATSTVRYALINATGSLGSWATTTAYPSAIGIFPAVVNNGFMYVIAGCEIGACTTVTSTVCFAPLNDDGTLGAWATTTAYPAAQYSFPAVVNNGFVYAIGGHDGTNRTSTVRYASLASKNLYWGVSVSSSQASGNYSSTITYTAIWSP